MIKSVLIANRGEIAWRIARTCKNSGIRTVAIYSDSDKNMPYLKECSCSIRLADDNYLNASEIISIAKKEKVDAIHPGYGFLSENPSFAKIVLENGLIFIGPGPDSLEIAGMKDLTKKIVEDAGYPVIPWRQVGELDNAYEAAKSLGYPIIIKAVHGGGGRGIRKVFSERKLNHELKSAVVEARASFGNEKLYMEKLILRPRHIEVQIVSDSLGNTFYLGERDCSTQRRFQKLIEETPSPIMNPSLASKLEKISIGIAKLLKITGVFTIEYLIDEDMKLYFMEINPRIQVEHAITEERYGIDLVRLQLQIANGESVKDSLASSICSDSYVIECRINAENIFSNFAPSTGVISKLVLPRVANLRIDTFIEKKMNISAEYDSLILKLILKAKNRDSGISMMISALKQLQIEGIKTNSELLQAILLDTFFVDGKVVDTEMIESIIDSLRIDDKLESKRVAKLIYNIVESVECGSYAAKKVKVRKLKKSTRTYINENSPSWFQAAVNLEQKNKYIFQYTKSQ